MNEQLAKLMTILGQNWTKKSALVFMKLERPQEETNCQMINDIE